MESPLWPTGITTTRRSTALRDAAEAPPEKLAYVAAFSRPADQADAIAVLDVDPQSERCGSVTGFTELPHTGDELPHFGWNACSSDSCCFPAPP